MYYCYVPQIPSGTFCLFILFKAIKQRNFQRTKRKTLLPWMLRQIIRLRCFHLENFDLNFEEIILEELSAFHHLFLFLFDLNGMHKLRSLFIIHFFSNLSHQNIKCIYLSLKFLFPSFYSGHNDVFIIRNYIITLIKIFIGKYDLNFSFSSFM